MRKYLLMLITLACCIEGAHSANRALLIGIGKYPTAQTGWKVIHGDADVALLSPVLRQHGFTDIKTLVNAQATKEAIVRELKSLVTRSQNGDKVYIHFSGHGQPIEDANDDEQAEFDESIIPYDACRYSKNGYAGEKHLIDDEYNPLLNAIKKKVGRDGFLFVAIDACYSRGMERGEETEVEDPDIIASARGTDDSFIVNGHSLYLKNVPRPQRFSLGGKMYVVSACLETERNYECKTPSGKMYGSLSYYIYTLLKKDADFTRWAQCFDGKDYRKYRIFQTSQHPYIIEYP